MPGQALATETGAQRRDTNCKGCRPSLDPQASTPQGGKVRSWSIYLLFMWRRDCEWGRGSRGSVLTVIFQTVELEDRSSGPSPRARGLQLVALPLSARPSRAATAWATPLLRGRGGRAWPRWVSLVPGLASGVAPSVFPISPPSTLGYPRRLRPSTQQVCSPPPILPPHSSPPPLPFHSPPSPSLAPRLFEWPAAWRFSAPARRRPRRRP